MKEYKIIKTQFNNSIKHVPVKHNDTTVQSSDISKQKQQYVSYRLKDNGVANLSQRDKEYYNNNQSKLNHVQSLPKIVIDKMGDYYVFYTTIIFNFKTTKSKPETYQEYFDYQYKKLNQLVDSNRKDETRKSIMILVPEKSYNMPYTGAFRYQGKASNRLHSPDHYHGYILIHKSNIARFKRRCVVDSDKGGFQLVDRLANPYPKAICRITHGNQLLVCYDSLLKPLATKADILNTAYYSNKNILTGDFSYDDVLYFSWKQ